jgi:hypothetical protein
VIVKKYVTTKTNYWNIYFCVYHEIRGRGELPAGGAVTFPPFCHEILGLEESAAREKQLFSQNNRMSYTSITFFLSE